jgi:diguanylate cyclase (GGDEF)-like protein
MALGGATGSALAPSAVAVALAGDERINSRAQEFSREIGQRSGRHGPSAEERLDAADERDVVATARDLAARARDAAADARTGTAAPGDAAPRAQAEPAHPLPTVAFRAAGQRNRAARRRAHNARQGALAAHDRRAAAGDRTQAARERLHALVDREILADQLAVADNDPLTGARTRAAGLADLDRELERCRRTGAPLGVAYVDVVGLKALNDSAGHDAGDDLLEHTVRVIKEHLRPYDLVIRLGGDEFLCAMSGTTLSETRQRMSLIVDALAAAPRAVKIRTGLAALTPGDSTAALVARADNELIAGPHAQHEVPTAASRRPRKALHEQLPAHASSVATLRQIVLDFAAAGGASERQREDIAVAVSEALNNVVVHAYAGQSSPGIVALDAWMSERTLEIVVDDEGTGMRPHITRATGLGLGLALIVRTTRRVEIAETTRGMRVCMTFAID